MARCSPREDERAKQRKDSTPDLTNREDDLQEGPGDHQEQSCAHVWYLHSTYADPRRLEITTQVLPPRRTPTVLSSIWWLEGKGSDGKTAVQLHLRAGMSLFELW